MRVLSAAVVVGVANAQLSAESVNSDFSVFKDRACDKSNFVEVTDFASLPAYGTGNACASGCEHADRCTGFEFSAANGCFYWFNGACSHETDLSPAVGATTFISTASFVPAPATTTTAKIVDRIPTTTVALAVAETTFEAMALSEDLYALKYPQQACQWNEYVEDLDWALHSTTSSSPESCAAACIAADDCTGFEVGSDSGSNYGNSPYCAFWFNDACSTPTNAYYGAVSVTTGEAIQVDTYTLTEPLDAFKEYEHRACAWSMYVEGEDWEFASKDSSDADACATLCLEAAGQGCTGFEVGSSSSLEYGDISQGYCAFWYNNTCGAHDMFTSSSDASTYVLVGSTGCGGYSQSHIFYVALLVAGLVTCIGVCCCCRRAMIRRRLAMRRAMARAQTAVRAAPGTAAVAAVTVAGGSRAVVYAVQVAEDQQEEPEKV